MVEGELFRFADCFIVLLLTYFRYAKIQQHSNTTIQQYNNTAIQQYSNPTIQQYSNIAISEAKQSSNLTINQYNNPPAYFVLNTFKIKFDCVYKSNNQTIRQLKN